MSKLKIFQCNYQFEKPLNSSIHLSDMNFLLSIAIYIKPKGTSKKKNKNVNFKREKERASRVNFPPSLAPF